jgi:hypothetical protein
LNERDARIAKAIVSQLISCAVAMRTIFEGSTAVPLFLLTVAFFINMRIPSDTLSNLQLLDTVVETRVEVPPVRVVANKQPQNPRIVQPAVIAAPVIQAPVAPAVVVAAPVAPVAPALDTIRLSTATTLWREVRGRPGAVASSQSSTTMITDPTLWSAGVLNDDPFDEAKGGTFQIKIGPGMQLRWICCKLMSWPEGVSEITSANIEEVNRRSKTIAFIVTNWYDSKVVYVPKIKCWLKKAISPSGMSREEMLRRIDDRTFATAPGALASTYMSSADTRKVHAWDWTKGYWERILTTEIVTGGGGGGAFANQNIPF